MLTRFVPSLLALALLFLFAHHTAPASEAACTVSWAGPVNGSWHDASKWDTLAVPNPSDIVCITQPGDYAVTAVGSVSVASLNHGNATGAQTLKIMGNSTVGSGNFYAPGGITNSGTIVLESADSAWDVSLSVENTTIANSGRIISAVGAGGPRIIHGSLQNSGQLLVGLSLMLSPDFASNTHTNTGIIHIAADQTFEINQDTFNQNAGQVQNLGEFRQVSGTFNLNSGQITGNPPYLQAGVLHYGPTPSHPAAIVGAGNVVLTSDIPANQTLRLRGDSTLGNAILQLNDSQINHGTLVLDTIDGAWDVFVTVAFAETLTNAGTTISAVGAGGNRTILGVFDNQGTLNVAQSLAVTADGCAGTQMTNTGTITIAAGQTFDFGQGCPNPVFNMNGGTVTGPGTFFLPAGPVFNFNGGQITGTPASLVSPQLTTGVGAGAARMVFHGTGSTISGNIKASQTITVLGDGTYGSATLTANASFMNNGRLVLDTIDGAWDVQIVLNNGATLVNNGALHIAPGLGGPRAIYGQTVNNGTAVVDQSLTHAVWGLAPQTAFVNHGNLSIAAGQMFTSQGQVFKQAAGDLAINGGLRVDSGMFWYAGGAVRGSNTTVHIVNSTLKLEATSAAKFLLNGGNAKLMGDIAAGQTVTVEGNGTYGPGHLTAPNGFINSGVLNLDSIDGAWDTNVIVPGNKLLVNNGTLNARAGAGGQRLFEGPIMNNGALNVYQFLQPGASFPTTLTNNGTLMIAVGAELRVQGMGRNFVQAAGKVSGGGLLSILGTHLNFTGGDFHVAPYLVDARLTLGLGSGAGTFDLRGQSNILAGNVKSGQTLRLQGNGTYGPAAVTTSGNLTNDGTISLDSIDGAWGVQVGVASGAFTNNGRINVLPGAGGERNIYGNFLNGLAGAVAFAADGAFIASSNPTAVINRGMMTVDPGRTVMANGQTVVLESGTLDLKGQFTMNTGVFRLKNGVLLGEPRLTNATLDLVSGTPARFHVEGSANTLIGKVEPGQVITLEGNGTLGGAVVTTPNDLLNSGEIILTSRDGTWTSQLDVPAGKTITNGIFGSIRVLASAGGAGALTGALDNRGALDVRANLAVQGGARYVSSGSIAVNGGKTLSFDGTFRNRGVVELTNSTLNAAGNSYIQDAGQTRLKSGVIAAAIVQLGGGNGLTGWGTITGDLVSSSSVSPDQDPNGGRIQVNGNYTQTPQGSLVVMIGGAQPNSGYSQLAVTGTATLAGMLDVQLRNSFVPAGNDRFGILTYGAQAGDFTTKSGLEYAPGQFFTPRSTPASYVLTAGASYSARIQLTTVPTAWTLGQMKPVAVTIMNRGSLPLNAAGANPVRLLAEFVDNNGMVITRKAAPLTGDIAPGASAGVAFDLTAPAGFGATRLHFTLVREGIGVIHEGNGQAISLLSPFKVQTSGVLTNLLAVSALHGNTAWAVGVGGTITMTTNGGNTWTPQTSGTVEHLRAVDAVDATTAWASGDNGMVLRTTNGGGTWSPAATGLTGIIYGVAGVSADTAWAVGENGMILRTDNGGTDWATQTSAATGTLYAISAVNGNVAWAVGDGAILRTVDGGTTWEPVLVGCCFVWQGVVALSDTHAWFAGADGAVKRSVDGVTVQYVGDFSFGPLRGITARLIDPGTAWITGADGHIRKTTDGGLSWHTQYVGFTPRFGISAAGSGIWAVGSGGTVVKATP